jgi:hypothetical protein
MTVADLPGLVGCADGKNDFERFRTWVVAQAIRNALQAFHGGWGFDPDEPGSGAGFISDGQMRALNITIRCAVHEALEQVDIARDAVRRPGSESSRRAEIAALDFCAFQLGTVRDYMEPPGSAELEVAYRRYVHEPDVNR